MSTATKPRRPYGSKVNLGEGVAAWVFTAPMLIILGLFLFIPVLMALWVSVSDWTGRGSPISGSVNFVGLENYKDVTSGGGLDERNFGISMRNNAWYVLLVVPIQTVISLFLALMVNRSVLRGRGRSEERRVGKEGGRGRAQDTDEEAGGSREKKNKVESGAR